MLLFAVLSFHISFPQKKNDNKDNLADHFKKSPKATNKERLTSPFSSKKNKQKERKLLPSFYATVIKKAAEHNQLPSYFNKKLQKEKERTQQPDFFSKPSQKNERVDSKDHFSKQKSEIKRSEDDLSYKAKPRKVFRKNFVGERRFYFKKDPNKKKTKRFKFKSKDPFGKRKKDEQQSVPRGEKDLFGNGVLPKMKDMR